MVTLVQAKKLTIDPKKFTNCAFLMKKTYMHHIYPLVDDVNARWPQPDDEVLVNVSENGREHWRVGKVTSVESTLRSFMVRMHRSTGPETEHENQDLSHQEGSPMKLDAEMESMEHFSEVGPLRMTYLNREWKWVDSAEEKDIKTEVKALTRAYAVVTVRQDNQNQLHTDKKSSSTSRKKRDREVGKFAISDSH